MIHAGVDHCVTRGSRIPWRGFCSGSPAASAGVAKLAGPVVSSRTKQHPSSSDPALHHRTGLLPSGVDAAGDPEQRRPQAAPPPNNATQPRTKTKPNSRVPPPSGGPQGAPPAVERPPEVPALDFRCPPNAAAARQTKRVRSDSDRRAPLPGHDRRPPARHDLPQPNRATSGDPVAH